MKAAVCYKFGKPMVVEDVVMDAPLQKGEVKVRLAATAVCHSDIHEWRGDIGGDVPYIGGHESSGYVEEVGKGVTKVKPGDPVVASVLGSCGECAACLMGCPHICQVMPPFFPLFYRARNKKGQKIRQDDLKTYSGTESVNVSLVVSLGF